MNILKEHIVFFVAEKKQQIQNPEKQKSAPKKQKIR